jgi:nucleotide-binding universal stress UspA family protein
MKVLLATDFSDPARVAHALVRDMRLTPGSQVRVVHAIEPVTTVQLFAPAAMLTISEVAEREAAAECRRVASELARTDIEADAVVGLGYAPDVIVDEAKRFAADLVVIGSRGRGGIATAVLGSVSAEVVDRAPCPVLIARGRTLSNVILAEDGSTYASVGARVIRDIPALRDVPVRVVSVVDVPFPTLAIDPASTASAAQVYRDYQAALPGIRSQHAALARDRASVLAAAGVSATSEQREGDAAAELIAAAVEHRADCIVVGSRGQTGLKRLALGSVARNVLFHAPCSVLIAHDRSEVSLKKNGHSPALAASGADR